MSNKLHVKGQLWIDQSFSDMFCIFLCEFFLIKISLKYVLIGPLSNKTALFQITAWHRTADKPYEPMIAKFADVYMRH